MFVRIGNCDCTYCGIGTKRNWRSSSEKKNRFPIYDVFCSSAFSHYFFYLFVCHSLRDTLCIADKLL